MEEYKQTITRRHFSDPNCCNSVRQRRCPLTAAMYTVPYISTPDPTNPNLRFLEEVSLRTAGVSRLEMCIQCGTCGGSCPSA